MISRIPSSANETTGATFHFATMDESLLVTETTVNGTKVEQPCHAKCPCSELCENMFSLPPEEASFLGSHTREF